MILILICLIFAWGIAQIAKESYGEASQIPVGILSFALLLFATGAV